MAELEIVLWFPYWVPCYKYKPKCWATSLQATLISLPKCQPKVVLQLCFTERQQIQHIIKQSVVTFSKETQDNHIKTSVSIGCSRRSLTVLPKQCCHCHFPRAQFVQISLKKALFFFFFFTGEHKLFSWHVALKKLHFSCTVAKFWFYFWSWDWYIYIFLIIAPMSICYCQLSFVAVLTCGGQIRTSTIRREIITSGTSHFPENL